jgi:methyl-accepting chemotaxis protein
MRSIRYDLYGAAAGVGLPLVGTAIEAWLRQGSLAPGALAAAFAGQPLLWIMATTPLVLGLLGRVIVRQHEEIVRQSAELLALEQARREAYHRTASSLFASAQGLLTNVSSLTATATETAASVKETTATLHALSQAATTAALTSETVIGIALQADRASEEGQRLAEASGAELLQLAADVRELSARIEELGARLADTMAATRVPDPAAASERLDRALAAAQRTMGGALEVARHGEQRAAAGVQAATRSGETVRHLAVALRDAARASREVAQVAQQQEGGIEQALKSMNGIALATQVTMTSTQAVAEEARVLNEVASALRRAVKAEPDAPEPAAG